MATIAPTSRRTGTPDRILRAAFECIQDVGLSRTSMEDVARAAGLSRQTIYRYYPSKDHLILALVLREEERFLDGIRAAFSTRSGLEEALRSSILFCLRFAREHPLLDRLLATDPETLLPFLTTRGRPVIARAREVLFQLISSKSWVRADTVRAATDAAVRVVISYALAPPDRNLEDVARELARLLTLGLTAKEGRHR